MLKNDLIGKWYEGANAKQYEKGRRMKKKWIFEESVFSKYYSILNRDVDSVLDAPVGTGRFISTYLSVLSPEKITGLDLSKDMLHVARKRAPVKGIVFDRVDIVSSSIKYHADLVVCFRFLNLVEERLALKTINNLLSVANKYLVVTVRFVNDEALRDHVIEDKIVLQYEPAIIGAFNRGGFKVLDVEKYKDSRPGEYCVILLGRV